MKKAATPNPKHLILRMSTERKPSSADAIATEGRRRWISTMERAAEPISRRMIELAELNPGDHVLDIATGSGDPALVAAVEVGERGRVVGVDTAEAILAFAREQAEGAKIENVTFLHMDAECLTFDPASFNAIFCKFGLMFFRNHGQVIHSAHQLLAKGGKFVASLWGSAEQVPAISITMEVLREQLDIRPSESSPHPFALAETSVVLSRLHDAGFTDLHIEPVPVIFEFRSPEQYMHYMHDVAHQINILFQEITPGQRTTIWDAIVDRAAQYRTPEGIVRFENYATVVVGRQG